MVTHLAVLAACLALFVALPARSKEGGAYSSYSTDPYSHHSQAAPGVERDAHGKIKRSTEAKRELQ